MSRVPGLEGDGVDRNARIIGALSWVSFSGTYVSWRPNLSRGLSLALDITLGVGAAVVMGFGIAQDDALGDTMLEGGGHLALTVLVAEGQDGIGAWTSLAALGAGLSLAIAGAVAERNESADTARGRFLFGAMQDWGSALCVMAAVTGLRWILDATTYSREQGERQTALMSLQFAIVPTDGGAATAISGRF
jgi:hypothetical protein